MRLTRQEVLKIANALNAEAKSFEASADRLGVPDRHPLRTGASENRALSRRLVDTDEVVRA